MISTAKFLEEIARTTAKQDAYKSGPSLVAMGVDQEKVERVAEWARNQTRYGVLATYIPQLAKVDPDKTAIAIGDMHGNEIITGDGVEVVASVQSVIKSFLYLFALKKGLSPELLSGVEATARPFNADEVLQPELEVKRAGHPLNNAGAISSAGAIDDFDEFLDFMRILTRNPELAVLQDVFESEMDENSNNRAIAQRLVVAGRFKTPADADKALEQYTRACSLGLTVTDLLRASLILASGGVNLANDLRVANKDDVVRVINAMNTFGMYEQSGRIALLTAGSRANSVKSGVGGLINSVDPHRGAFATYSPLLNSAGNSTFGSNAMVGLNAMLSAPDAMRLSPEETARELETMNAKESEAVHREILRRMQRKDPQHTYRYDPQALETLRRQLGEQISLIVSK